MEPALIAVITPDWDTVATDGLLLVHITFLFVAFDGATVAVKVILSPLIISADVLSRRTPVTGTITVTSHVAVLMPSALATVIMVVPLSRPVTFPFWFTLAMAGDDEDH